MQRAKIISEALIHRLELEAAKMVDKPTVRVGELGGGGGRTINARMLEFWQARAPYGSLP